METIEITRAELLALVLQNETEKLRELLCDDERAFTVFDESVAQDLLEVAAVRETVSDETRDVIFEATAILLHIFAFANCYLRVFDIEKLREVANPELMPTDLREALDQNGELSPELERTIEEASGEAILAAFYYLISEDNAVTQINRKLGVQLIRQAYDLELIDKRGTMMILSRAIGAL